MKDAISLTPPLTFAELQACPTCYAGKVQLASSPSAMLASLRTQVIEPIMNFQRLFDDHAYVTRLYTTMSAREMTADPVFAFNASLPSVSNVHQAERVIECNPDVFQSQAPWRVELPQGLVRGVAQNWPVFDSQPANTRILRLAPTGDGVVLEDNSEVITEQLDAHNQTVASGGTPGTGGTNGQGNPTGGSNAGGDSGGGDGETLEPGGGGGCALAFGGERSRWGVLIALGIAGLSWRRRRGPGARESRR